MNVEVIDDPALIQAIGESVGPRTRGDGIVHLSDIIKRVCKKLDAKRFGNGPMNLEKVEFGLLFELLLEEALKRRFLHAHDRPGEIVKDGIWMSPDGINLTELAVEEYKATWMSSRKGVFDQDAYGNWFVLEKFQHWLWQIMAYCYAMEVEKAMLRVLFVNGDYTHPLQPTFQHFRLTFTADQLTENWAFILREGQLEGLL